MAIRYVMTATATASIGDIRIAIDIAFGLRTFAQYHQPTISLSVTLPNEGYTAWSSHPIHQAHSVGCDLATSDQDSAKAFYADLMGWSYIDNPVGAGYSYSTAQFDNKDVAAIFTMPEAQASMGIPPHWQSYVTVSSADEAADKAKGLGATVLMEPFDVMTAGRMAVIQDPGGAVFNVWQPIDNCGAALANCPGAFFWNELLTKDVEGSKTFYTGMFDWTSDTMDMGPMQYTSFKRGDRGMAGMLEINPEWGDVPPHWNVYLTVEDCDASLEKAVSLGGKVIEPARDIPEVGRFGMVADPQGATFALIALTNPE
jgi:predicted enzyme related to lactoylglutathione lyase